MRCVICDSNDWENVDRFRIKAEGMCMCKKCGFISYPSKWKSEDEMKQYYRKDYRNPPKVSNFFTGQRKLHYHNAFLRPLFDEWAEAGKSRPVVCEIGAAYGMFLNYLKEVVPGAEVYGTELTLSYRRNAFHEFGLNLTEEFDHSRDYDLICSYKVAEHQFDIDRYLMLYRSKLKPGGYLYISVPTWLNRMTNFGASGFDLEYYYHPNHINVWTRTLFETLLNKCGFKIVRYNNSMYDDTYLCVADERVANDPPAYESPDEILGKLERIHRAGIAYLEGRFDDAIATWPDFPEAHVSRYEGKRAEFHKGSFKSVLENVIDVAVKSCPDSPEAWGLAGDLHMRYDKFHDAIKCFEKVLELRPGQSSALRGIAHSLRSLGNIAARSGQFSEATGYYTEARNVTRYLRQVSEQDQHDALTWVYDDNSRIPMPSEA